MILITGASSGIGKYLFTEFSKTNIAVFGTFFSTNPVNQKNYSKVNVTIFEEVNNWIQTLPIDKEIVLINCAGINRNEIFHKSNPENWFEVINTNVMGVYNTCRALIPYMRENNYGRIINLSSVVAQKGVSGTASYATSKSALWGLVKALSNENAKYNISANNLNLGYFNTGMIKDIQKKMLTKIKNDIPSKRLGEPSEILNAVQFLINTPYVNGTNIDINGALY